jgi:hypothetical protein
VARDHVPYPIEDASLARLALRATRRRAFGGGFGRGTRRGRGPATVRLSKLPLHELLDVCRDTAAIVPDLDLA